MLGDSGFLSFSLGREDEKSWSCGYGRGLTAEWQWVCYPVPNTRWFKKG